MISSFSQVILQIPCGKNVLDSSIAVFCVSSRPSYIAHNVTPCLRG